MTTTTTTQTVKASPRAGEGRERAEETRPAPVFRPYVDILEGEKEILLIADVPGARGEDIDINFEDGELTVHARVAARGPESSDSFLLCEYGVGDFRRVFRLGENIDANAITAEHKDGTLTLHLPKTESARPRRIEVNRS